MSDAQPPSESPPLIWRPTLFSTVTAVTIASVSIIGLAVMVETLLPALLGTVAGGALGVTVIAVGTATRRVTVAIGGFLATFSGLAVLAAISSAVLTQAPWPPVPPFDVLAAAPLLFAFAGIATGFGAFAAARDLSPLSDAGLTALRLLGIGLIPAGAVILEQIRLPVAPVIDAITVLFKRVFVPTHSSQGVEAAVVPFIELMTLLFLTAAILGVAVRRLPLVALAGESTRPTARTVQRQLRRLCTGGMLIALSAGIGVPSIIRLPEMMAIAPPIVTDAIPVIASSPLARQLLGVGMAAGIITIGVLRITRTVASTQYRRSSVPVVPLVVGSCITLAVSVTHDAAATIAIDRATSDAGRALLRELLAMFGSFTILSAVVLLGLVTAIVVTLVLSLLHASQLLSSHSGTQIAGSGVFLAAVSTGIADGSVVAVFGGVAMSLLVWDLGEFGTTLGREIGQAGVSRRAEVVHSAGSMVYAAFAVGLGVGTLAVVTRLPSLAAPTTTVAVMAASVGTILLFVATR